MITGRFGSNSITRIRSASGGRSRRLSTACSASRSASVRSVPPSNSTRIDALPSTMFEVSCLTPSRSATASSTLRTIDSSISEGVAPG